MTFRPFQEVSICGKEIREIKGHFYIKGFLSALTGTENCFDIKAWREKGPTLQSVYLHIQVRKGKFSLLCVLDLLERLMIMFI